MHKIKKINILNFLFKIIMGNQPGLEVMPGFAGAALSMSLSNLGAAYGMGKSGCGIAGLG